MSKRAASPDSRACLFALSAGLLLTQAAPAQPVAEAPPSKSELADLTEALDLAFEQHAIDEFLALFEGLHLPVLEREQERLSPFFQSDWKLERNTEIVDHWELGSHAVAHVSVEIKRTDVDPNISFTEHQLIAATRTPNGPRVTLAVEIATEFLPFLTEGLQPKAPGRGFQCAACNYVIDARADWLTVPNCSQRVGCLESLSFYALEQDLTVHLTVVMAERAQAPKPWLEQISRKHGLEFDSPIRPWTPAAYATATRPELMQAVRATAKPTEVNRSTEFYFVTYARLGYLIEVEGRAPTVATKRDAVSRLLQSFMLLEPQIDPGELVDRVLTMRDAGRLEDDGSYVHDGFRLRIAPPAGWTTALNTSTHTFELAFRPQGSDVDDRKAPRVLIRGMRPLRGFERWTPRATRMQVRKLLPESFRPERMGNWFETEADAPTWVGTFAFALEDTGYPVRELRLAARDDLLVVFEALSGDETDRDRLEKVLEGFADAIR